jgi:outer membrane protein assembly factor BamB
VINIRGRTQVVVGQGDGWLRSFETGTGKLIWKCDLNPKGVKYEPGGHGRRSYVMATPVSCDGRIYVAPGQDPEHSEGPGELFCVDPTGTGDVSAELDDGRGKGKANPNSHVVWRYGGPDAKADAEKLHRDFAFGRTLANCTIHDGLVYACDISGYAYCLDAKNGRLYWVHDLRAAIWCGPLWADGKVYVVTEDGDVWIFAHGKVKKELKKIDMGYGVRSTPAFANGVLYVRTDTALYAIQEKK